MLIFDPGRPGPGYRYDEANRKMSLRSLHVDRMKSKIQKIKPTMQLAVAVPSLRALRETSQGSRRDRKGEIRQRPQRGQIPNVFAPFACSPNLAEALDYTMHPGVRCQQAVFARFA
jgi:hypothetical protein